MFVPEEELKLAEKKTITHKVEQHIAVLSTTAKGWTKELNLISWNDKPAKYDIRDWNPDKTAMGKGVTLTSEEAAKLVDALMSLRES